mmetsp:Transcript_115481/g.172544  ORF Transcript_115481/g.172544 Transcript_115481/m.172544 type:complete len:526 (+) Transcript_115481:35-1612(+)
MFKAEDVQKGVQAIWNSQVEEADEIFKAESATNARHALHYAENLWFWSFITDNKKLQGEAAVRLKASKKIAEANHKAAQKLKGKEPEVLNQQIEGLIIYGEVILFQAFLQMSASFDYARACMGLSKAWGYVQEAEKLSREEGVDEDLILLLQFDLGVFLFFLSFLPEVLGFAARLLSLMGFKGDREKGFGYLDRVAHSDSIRSPFAYSILAAKYLYMSENVFPISPDTTNLANARTALDEVLVKCPDGLGFLTLHGICLRRFGKHEEANTIFRDICSRYQAKNVDDSLPRLNLGNGEFNMFHWQEASDLFSTVEKSETYLRTYNASMFRAICELQQGDVDAAHNTMTAALKSGKNDGDFKCFAERYVGNPHSGFWETLIERDELNWDSQEAFQTAQNLLNDFKNDLGINATDKGETAVTKKLKHDRKTKEWNVMLSHFVQARLDSHNGNVEGAIKNFTAVINSMKAKTDFEKTMLYQSYFECADLHYKQGNKADAQDLLKKVSKDAHSSRFKSAASSALAYIAAN